MELLVTAGSGTRAPSARWQPRQKLTAEATQSCLDDARYYEYQERRGHDVIEINVDETRAEAERSETVEGLGVQWEGFQGLRYGYHRPGYLW